NNTPRNRAVPEILPVGGGATSGGTGGGWLICAECIGSAIGMSRKRRLDVERCLACEAERVAASDATRAERRFRERAYRRHVFKSPCSRPVGLASEAALQDDTPFAYLHLPLALLEANEDAVITHLLRTVGRRSLAVVADLGGFAEFVVRAFTAVG